MKSRNKINPHNSRKKRVELKLKKNTSPQTPVGPVGPRANGWAKTTAVLLFANILRNVGLLLILVLLARLTDQDTVGRYTLALAITAPLFVFGQFGLRNVYLTFRTPILFHSYTVLQLGTLILALASSLILAIFIAPDLLVTVLLVGTVKIADSAAEFFAGPLQKYGRIWPILTASFTTAAIGTVVTAVTLSATRDLNVTLAALAASSLALTATLLGVPARIVASANEKGKTFVVKRLAVRQIFFAGLPIGSAGAVLALVSSTPQFFLSMNFDRAAVGHFAVLLYVYALADIFTATMTQAWLPDAKTRAEHETYPAFIKFLKTTTSKSTLIYVPVIVAGLTLATPLVPTIFGANYLLTLNYALPLGIALLALPAAHFGGGALLALNHYRHSITLAAIAAAVSLISSAILIPSLGISGALWSCTVATLARGITSFVILRQSSRKAANELNTPR